MATGIVSTAVDLAGYEGLSRILLGLDVAVWAVLASTVLIRAATKPSRLRADACQLGALTAVAANAVLGTRLALLGHSTAATCLLCIAAALWIFLLPLALRHRPQKTTGLELLLTVSTQSLAVLAATLAPLHGAGWLVVVAFLLLCLGLALYPLGFRNFPLSYLRTGDGDMWISGGALAISALAAAKIALATQRLAGPEFLLGWIDDLALALWAAAMVWLPALLAAEAIWPRFHYNMRRWSTVFPVGMFAAMSFSVADATQIEPIDEAFADWWVWVAVAVWCVVAAGLARRAAWLAKGRAVT